MKNKISRLYNWLFDNLSVPKILSISFLFVIFVGTILLALPISNLTKDVTLLDHLFTATTSTCVTGLLTVTVKNQYTLFGKFIIMCMIQIGGLGLMTVISVVLLFTNAKLNFKERLLLKDALNKMDFSSISQYVKSIFKFTFVFESIGAFVYFLAFYFMEGIPFIESIGHAIFLSISAFCNAGIDCFGSTSLLNFQTNPIIILNTSFLIIIGGIGFAVWFDYYYQLRMLYRLRNKVYALRSKLKIHTKLVTYLTLALIFGGMFIILILEYNNSLVHLSLFDKIVNAFFNSVTLRTAGFFTIDYSILHRVTKVIMIGFMLIGGSPGGTAGGIKTTTFFLLIYAVYNEFNQKERLHIFNRHIKKSNFIKAYTIFGIYLLFIIITWLIMLCIESYDSIDLLYEIVSAIATVGLTIGITSSLSTVGKLIIIFLMFIGRVGPITILYSIAGDSKNNDNALKYPSTEIIVG